MLDWRLKPFVVKNLLVHLRGMDDFRTFLEDTEEKVQIPSYRVPA